MESAAWDPKRPRGRGNTLDAQQTSARVSVHVYNRFTDEPVVGAAVSIAYAGPPEMSAAVGRLQSSRNVGSGFSGHTVANDAGWTHCEVLAPGYKYVVTCTCTGFQPFGTCDDERVYIAPQAGEQITRAVAMVPSPSGTMVTIRLLHHARPLGRHADPVAASGQRISLPDGVDRDGDVQRLDFVASPLRIEPGGLLVAQRQHSVGTYGTDSDGHCFFYGMEPSSTLLARAVETTQTPRLNGAAWADGKSMPFELGDPSTNASARLLGKLVPVASPPAPAPPPPDDWLQPYRLNYHLHNHVGIGSFRISMADPAHQIVAVASVTDSASLVDPRAVHVVPVLDDGHAPLEIYATPKPAVGNNANRYMYDAREVAGATIFTDNTARTFVANGGFRAHDATQVYVRTRPWIDIQVFDAADPTREVGREYGFQYSIRRLSPGTGLNGGDELPVLVRGRLGDPANDVAFMSPGFEYQVAVFVGAPYANFTLRLQRLATWVQEPFFFSIPSRRLVDVTITVLEEAPGTPPLPGVGLVVKWAPEDRSLGATRNSVAWSSNGRSSALGVAGPEPLSPGRPLPERLWLTTDGSGRAMLSLPGGSSVKIRADVFPGLYEPITTMCAAKLNHAPRQVLTMLLQGAGGPLQKPSFSRPVSTSPARHVSSAVSPKPAAGGSAIGGAEFAPVPPRRVNSAYGERPRPSAVAIAVSESRQINVHSIEFDKQQRQLNGTGIVGGGTSPLGGGLGSNTPLGAGFGFAGPTSPKRVWPGADTTPATSRMITTAEHAAVPWDSLVRVYDSVTCEQVHGAAFSVSFCRKEHTTVKLTTSGVLVAGNTTAIDPARHTPVTSEAVTKILEMDDKNTKAAAGAATALTALQERHNTLQRRFGELDVEFRRAAADTGASLDTLRQGLNQMLAERDLDADDEIEPQRKIRMRILTERFEKWCKTMRDFMKKCGVEEEVREGALKKYKEHLAAQHLVLVEASEKIKAQAVADKEENKDLLEAKVQEALEQMKEFMSGMQSATIDSMKELLPDANFKKKLREELLGVIEGQDRLAAQATKTEQAKLPALVVALSASLGAEAQRLQGVAQRIQDDGSVAIQTQLQAQVAASLATFTQGMQAVQDSMKKAALKAVAASLAETEAKQGARLQQLKELEANIQAAAKVVDAPSDGADELAELESELEAALEVAQAERDSLQAQVKAEASRAATDAARAAKERRAEAAQDVAQLEEQLASAIEDAEAESAEALAEVELAREAAIELAVQNAEAPAASGQSSPSEASEASEDEEDEDEADHNTTTTYELKILTGDREEAGTSAKVSFTLHGITGKDAGPLSLTHLTFNHDSAVTTNVTVPDLGNLTALEISHDNTGVSPGWFLDSVVVTNKSNGHVFTFPCDRWLAKDEDDGAIARRLEADPNDYPVDEEAAHDHLTTQHYNMQVTTSDLEEAGTDAKVTYTLYGASGRDAGPFCLEPVEGFKQGTTRGFLPTFPGLGNLTYLEIGHDNAGLMPGWHLHDVVITDTTNGRVFNFPCDRWLAEDEDDGKIRRRLKASPNDYLNDEAAGDGGRAAKRAVKQAAKQEAKEEARQAARATKAAARSAESATTAHQATADADAFADSELKRVKAQLAATIVELKKASKVAQADASARGAAASPSGDDGTTSSSTTQAVLAKADEIKDLKERLRQVAGAMKKARAQAKPSTAVLSLDQLSELRNQVQGWTEQQLADSQEQALQGDPDQQPATIAYVADCLKGHFSKLVQPLVEAAQSTLTDRLEACEAKLESQGEELGARLDECVALEQHTADLEVVRRELQSAVAAAAAAAVDDTAELRARVVVLEAGATGAAILATLQETVEWAAIQEASSVTAKHVHALHAKVKALQAGAVVAAAAAAAAAANDSSTIVVLAQALRNEMREALAVERAVMMNEIRSLVAAAPCSCGNSSGGGGNGTGTADDIGNWILLCWGYTGTPSNSKRNASLSGVPMDADVRVTLHLAHPYLENVQRLDMTYADWLSTAAVEFGAVRDPEAASFWQRRDATYPEFWNESTGALRLPLHTLARLQPDHRVASGAELCRERLTAFELSRRTAVVRITAGAAGMPLLPTTGPTFLPSAAAASAAASRSEAGTPFSHSNTPTPPRQMDRGASHVTTLSQLLDAFGASRHLVDDLTFCPTCQHSPSPLVPPPAGGWAVPNSSGGGSGTATPVMSRPASAANGGMAQAQFASHRVRSMSLAAPWALQQQAWGFATPATGGSEDTFTWCLNNGDVVHVRTAGPRIYVEVVRLLDRTALSLEDLQRRVRAARLQAAAATGDGDVDLAVVPAPPAAALRLLTERRAVVAAQLGELLAFERELGARINQAAGEAADDAAYVAAAPAAMRTVSANGRNSMLGRDQ